MVYLWQRKAGFGLAKARRKRGWKWPALAAALLLAALAFAALLYLSTADANSAPAHAPYSPQDEAALAEILREGARE